jgi:hypothetical protein
LFMTNPSGIKLILNEWLIEVCSAPDSSLCTGHYSCPGAIEHKNHWERYK